MIGVGTVTCWCKARESSRSKNLTASVLVGVSTCMLKSPTIIKGSLVRIIGSMYLENSVHVNPVVSR